MACNCSKADRRQVWSRHMAGMKASLIAAQLMVHTQLVEECIAKGDPDAVKVKSKKSSK